jgi:hypothetical protein
MRTLLHSLITLLLVSVPLQAHAAAPNESGVGQAVICDTAPQVERLVALQSEGADMQRALQAVNEEAQNPRACGVAVVMFTLGQAREHKVVQGKAINIVEITVHAISDGSSWARVPAISQYTIIADQGVEI